MPIAPPPNLADAQIVVEVRCRRCAYDLRGLSLDGRCPECGLDVWLSVQHVVDPAASILPRLRDPIGVGNGLLWLILCTLLSHMLLLAHAASSVTFPGVTSRWELPPDVLLIAALLPLAALWSVYRFVPPNREETEVAVRADLRLLGLALLGWFAAGLLLWYHERSMMDAGLSSSEPDLLIATSALHTALALSAAAGLRGLRGILGTIGQRSREYRRAQGGRQSIKPMIAAVLGVAAGNVLRIFGTLWEQIAPVEVIGTTLERVCAIMLLIGGAYLLVNAIWIRRSLRKPPPRLDDLVRTINRPS